MYTIRLLFQWITTICVHVEWHVYQQTVVSVSYYYMCPRGVTWIPANCCVSELLLYVSTWSDMYTSRLLFQWATTICLYVEWHVYQQIVVSVNYYYMCPRGVTCIPANGCVSELLLYVSTWSDMYTNRLLFQWATTICVHVEGHVYQQTVVSVNYYYINPTRHDGLVKCGLHHIMNWNVTCSRHDIALKIAPLALSNNHSIVLFNSWLGL
jgi:hypothetical protein